MLQIRHRARASPRPDELSLQDLIEKPATLPMSELDKLKLDPTDPCIFQLSGGTTGIPKLIPRTHNDYAYNSKHGVESVRRQRRFACCC